MRSGRQRLEYLPCVTKICSIASFVEQSVAAVQHLAGIILPALFSPQACKAHGGAKFQRFGDLTAGAFGRRVRTRFGVPTVVGRAGEQYFAS
jgi:hypothetical protein